MAICTPHMKKPILSNNYSNKLVVSYLPLALFDKGPENHSVGVWQRLPTVGGSLRELQRVGERNRVV